MKSKAHRLWLRYVHDSTYSASTPHPIRGGARTVRKSPMTNACAILTRIQPHREVRILGFQSSSERVVLRGTVCMGRDMANPLRALSSQRLFTKAPCAWPLPTQLWLGRCIRGACLCAAWYSDGRYGIRVVCTFRRGSPGHLHRASCQFTENSYMSQNMSGCEIYTP